MLHEGKVAVVSTMATHFVPPHSSKVCLVDSIKAGKEYIEKTFTEQLGWYIEDFGAQNIQSDHDEDWSYAKIQDPNSRNGFLLEFYLCQTVHDPR